MRFLIVLLSVVAISVAGVAAVLPVEYSFVYVGYVGFCVAIVAALYGVVELIRIMTGRPSLLRPSFSIAVLFIVTCVAVLYLHDELLPTRGKSLDGRLMTKLRLVIPDSPSRAPSTSP